MSKTPLLACCAAALLVGCDAGHRESATPPAAGAAPVPATPDPTAGQPGVTPVGPVRDNGPFTPKPPGSPTTSPPPDAFNERPMTYPATQPSAPDQTTMPMTPPPTSQPATAPSASIQKSDFGTTPDGAHVDLYTLTNRRGMVAKIATYGATLTQLLVPDRDGKIADVTLGFDNLKQYETQSPYFGATIGRYGNRIAKGTFELDGKTYTLATNNGPNHLHGGMKGFDKKVWAAAPSDSPDGPSLKLTCQSPDGEEGYPGTLDVAVTYTLTDADALRIDYSATTDAATVFNPTNHTYFNLGGEGSGSILDETLTVNADAYLPVDADMIPTGELKPVKGTPFDFTMPTVIGSRFDRLDNGYDHNFVLNHKPGEVALAARLSDPTSGRVMEVRTDQPGIQVYTGNFLDGKTVGAGGNAYAKNGAVCLETQHFPDSPNHPSFPSTELKPGETFKSTTIYQFLPEPRAS